MSGSRCKELKRRFRGEHGRSPSGAVKEMFTRTGIFFGKRMTWLQMLVITPSEWRQFKKASAV